ncbi:MAG: amino acid adenylation domain-containing protein [Candidatus Aminicenantes bacterium]|nr:amino acid adenylation domain-containing protein [Candidatus Aminicenantes bacterium]NIM77279.1 amino acid adenylation domain-containing protein [Candidatus Aminicenantes bacterium]NIN16580.1 amino acid adenylation domain-containing protein [Candidatus Aminicenantes bacterium]NIN40438.1 amino acid adenylation domain-containing protein [Candidatus Aminicenantes bacterium]NIN83258.1 amino acid adenylation domain-containing protein [Candidatus Aminicenantes bacterium]
MTEVNEANDRTGLEIAVIGMALRFPGAQNVDEFWENIKNGVESITFFSDEELEAEGTAPGTFREPGYVKAKGILQDIENFDSSFFGYTPKEAEIMDPQIRIFHECAWEALENAGYDPGSYSGLIGLYAGSAANVLWVGKNLIQIRGGADRFSANNLNSNFFSTLISYKLNLKGSSLTVQTACSTSLVAIHFACRSLLTGEVDMALAGGITVNIPQKTGYQYQEGMILSADGHCRAFAAESTGTIGGEGVGIVILKPLVRALDDGDYIHAIIKGSAANNDGDRKVGYTAPSVEGQVEVITAALEMAEVEPESITYVETHGTGTSLGDPIEIEALKLAFNTNKKGFCSIGSVKTNVGHLDCAAGVAGFIKAVQALTHRLIPPSLHFKKPNPKIDFENSPFYVNTELAEWKSNEHTHPLRAGVSSFGIGGTNAHVILEEWPDKAGGREQGAGGLEGRPQLILLSAKTSSALDRATRNLREFFKENPGLSLADAAYTLQLGRGQFKHRRMLVCRDSSIDEAIDALESMDEPSPREPEPGKPYIHTFFAEEGKKHVVFMFPGQGSQYVNMGLELYRTEPVFHETMDRCLEILDPLVGCDVKAILYPDGDEEIIKEEREPKTRNSQLAASSAKINQTEITQPLIFAIEYALARLLMKWGIKADAMIGHSIGEYVVACLAGVFSLEDALKLVALRGKLMQSVPPGSMLSVPLSEEALKQLLTGYEDIALAAVNTTGRCVVSGPHGAINDFAALLEKKGSKTRKLHTSHAFHSRMMDPILSGFEKNVAQAALNSPQIPYISNVTGTWITVEQAVDPGYWADHLRRTVQFSTGLGKLLEKKNAVFIEIGPGKVLSTFVRQHADKLPGQPVLNLVRHPDEKVSDTYFLLDKIGRLWGSGLKIDWHEFHGGEKRHRIPLPTYPFEKRRFSVEGDMSKIFSELQPGIKAAGERAGIDDWFYVPSWKRVDIDGDVDVNQDHYNWVVFIDDCGVGQWLADQLKETGQDVTVVKPGKQFKKQEGGKGEPITFVIDTGQPGHYDRLFAELSQQNRMPQRMVHLWGVTGNGMHELDPVTETKAGMEQVKRMGDILDRGFYSLLNTARAVGLQNYDKTLRVDVVTDHLQEVVGTEELQAEKALVLGAVRVIPKEYPQIRCRSIDIELPATGNHVQEELVSRLRAELYTHSSDRIVALRGRHRWVQHFEPVHLEQPKTGLPRLKKKGVYLITGGFGGMGLTFAGYLAETLQARLILVDKPVLPPRDQWQDWLNSPGSSKDSRIGFNIRKVQELENRGANVLAFSADIANYQQMKDVFNQAVEQFGGINGVFHTAGIGDYAGVIHLRKQEQSDAVLAPKLKGTLVLDELLEDAKLEPDFLVFCSSLSSFIAPFGQVAYTAANAFLDAFAIRKNLKGKTFTVSINWDSWREVGMAVQAVEKFVSAGVEGIARPTSQPGDVEHPLFDGCIEENPHRRVFVSDFRVDKHWVLEEHRILGKAVLPGTAYLEMARAAFEHHVGNTRMEMREIYFLNPLMVEDEEQKEVHTILENQEKGNEFEFSIISRGAPGDNQWQTHAAGKISALDVSAEPSTPYHIEEIAAGCNKKEKIYTEKNQPVSGGVISAGPRWENFKQIKTGEGQGLALLELPPAFASDVRDYKLHPALVDAAVSFLIDEYQDNNPYLPFSFKKVRIKAPVPTKIYSHSLYIEKKKSREKNLEFNITIMDEQGVELVSIEGYTLVVVSRDRSADLEVKSFDGHSRVESPKQDPLKNAIRPAEGIEVINRILSAAYPQVLVSTADFPAVYEKAENFSISGLEEALDLSDKPDSLPLHPRPELSRAYAAPGNETEQALANTWQEFFGIQQIGVFDDFFELGGDSLKALSLLTKIQKEFHSDVSLTDFFNSPFIRGMADIIAGSGKRLYTPIEPSEKKEYYLLSSAQKRLFFIQQLDLESTTYNLPEIVRLEGRVEKGKIETTYKKLVERYENFRTSFEMMGEEAVQQIHQEVDFKIEYFDLTTGDLESVESGGWNDDRQFSQEKVIRDFIRPFDLSQAPLIRVGLIKEKTQGYILIEDTHHIIIDATSYGIFLREFMELYAGKELSPVRLQYKDYSELHNHGKGSDYLGSQEAFWLEQFKEEIPVLHLPTDYARPAFQSFEGDKLHFKVGSKETAALRRIAQQEGATLYMVLLAVFFVLSAKLSNQDDIIIGSPTAGRRHADLQQMIGMFVNTLALRNNIVWEDTFTVFLRKVKQNVLKAFENQDYQFEDLVEKLGEEINRDTSRNPLFDVMFSLQNMEFSDLKIPGLTLKPYEFKRGTAKFDLMLLSYEIEDWLGFTFEYCSKLFKEETIERFANFSKKIITQVAEDPRKRISHIEIISKEEKQQLLVEFNDTFKEYIDRTIHELFETQAAAAPDRIAAVGRSRLACTTSITYRMLNEKSNRLAHLLRAKGVAPDTVVGLMTEPSGEMIVGILAILKAGGAYLPLDPGHPEARIKYMLTDSGAFILLTGQKYKNRCDYEVEIIDLESDDYFMGDTGNPAARSKPGNLAYIIYTSGTTGNPRGSLTTHHNVLRVVNNTNYIELKPNDRILQLSNYAFDGSVFDIYGALLNGASLVVMERERGVAVDRLASVIEKESITVFFVTTALFNTLVELKPGCLAHIRKVLFGGERVSVEHCKKALAGLGASKIIHVYGPTETTVYATYYFIDHIDESASTIPIGRPISNTAVYILDKGLKPVPIGIHGEICIGGDGVARGYLNRPELTAEKFISIHHSSFIIHCLYLTGDLARWLPEGSIEFFGRIDDQVKIRGFRIEPGEITHRLRGHDKVNEAVVVVRESKTGEKYLCAYIVARQEIGDRELKEYLSGDLPDYMVPAHIVILDKIPLTPNGKVDRKALPEPEVITTESYSPARDEVEKTLVEIWLDVLGFGRDASNEGMEELVGIDSNFFDLGGHSLKASILTARIHRALGVKIPLPEVFRTPTVRGLAKFIKNASGDKYEFIDAVEEKEYYRISSAEERVFVASQLDENSINYNIPMVVELEGVLHRDRLEGALSKLIRRHEILRTSFQTINQEACQRVHSAGNISFAIEYLKGGDSPGDDVKNFIRPFDLSWAPLMRFGLIKLAEEKHILMVDMHHIITDGTSLGIFLRELLFLYSDKQLPELRLQYKDFSEWQNSIQQDEDQDNSIKRQEQYWLGRFEGDIPQLALPTDFSRPPVQEFEGNVIISTIDKQLAVEVSQLASGTETTVYMVLLAVFNILLSKYTLQEDIVVGTGVAGRRHADLENIIGMFVNMLSMRNQPGAEKRFTEFLQEVKKNAIDGFENQDYQFEELVEKLDIPRGTGRNPIFDVEFTLQNTAVMEMKYKVPGIQIKSYDTIEVQNTKFDLSLEAMEGPNGISMILNYSTALFKRSTAEKMVDHYIEILQQVLENREIKLKDIRLSHKLSAAPVDINEEETLFGI